MNSGCGLPEFANDQQCDDENNSSECNFDGGACCNNNIVGWDTYCTDCECLQGQTTTTTTTTTTSTTIKGQEILKGNCGVFNSPKKSAKKI